MHKITYFLFSLTALLTIACKETGNTGQNNGPSTLEADGYRVEPARFTSTISSTANLLPFESVELKTPVEGNVLKIYFEEGQFVDKGDVIVRIDDRTWKAQLHGLKAQLTSARNELERKEELLDIEGASHEEVDQARATVQDLQARIDELAIRIDLANVKAPFSGRLGMRDFSQGAFLDKGATITNLVQTGKIKVDFSIPAKYAAYLEEGQPIKVLTNTGQDTARARIYAIGPMLNTSSRSIQVRALLKNRDNRFIAGNFGEVVLSIAESKQTLFVPSESIIPELNSHVVYKVENGKAKRQEVEVGNRTSTRVQIIDGLTPGDTVLVTGLLEVSEGQVVHIRKLKEEGAL